MPGALLVGAKWPTTPITYSIATSNAASSPGQPFSSFIPPSDPLGIARDVANDVSLWSYLTGLQFEQVPDSTVPGSVPDIRIGFGTLSGGALSATAYASSGGVFLPGTQILLQDPSVTPLLATYQGSTVSPLQLVFAEIGHAIGIAASSDLTSALNPANAGPSSTNLFYQDRSLSPSDVAAVEALYGTVLPTSITQAVLRHDVVTVGPSIDRYGNRIPGDDATAHGIPGGTVTLPSVYLGTVLVSLTPGGSMQLQVNQPGGATATIEGSRVAEIAPGDALTDPTGNAEQVARLFQAVLDRQPDLGSLYMYANDVDQGTLSLAQVGTILASSPEFLQKFPAATGTSASAQAAFVNALYQNLFGRPADGGGAGYVAALQGGESEGQLALDVSRSVEARTDYLSVEGDRSYGELYRLYAAAFGRAPDPSGEGAYLPSLDQGVSTRDIAASLLSSPEFAATPGAGSDTAFVTQTYENVLGRVPDAGGLAGYTAALATGGFSRAQVLADISNGGEARAHTALATHDGWVLTT